MLSLLLPSTGVDAPPLEPKTEDTRLLLLLPPLRLLLRRLRLLLLLLKLLLLLCLGGVSAPAEDDGGGGLLMREAVGWGLLGGMGCLVACLLPRVITLNTTGLLPPVLAFHLLLLPLVVLPAVLVAVESDDADGAEGLALMLRTGVHARCPRAEAGACWDDGGPCCLLVDDPVGCMNLGTAAVLDAEDLGGIERRQNR